jgi:hypothetical protein
MFFINIKKPIFLALFTLSTSILQANPSGYLLDIDQDGKVYQKTDATLVMRYLLGFRGVELTDKALGAEADIGYLEIEKKLSMLVKSGMLDINGDGEVKALEDALLLSRWLIGMRGNDLIRGVIKENSSRKSSKEISNYIKITFAF